MRHHLMAGTYAYQMIAVQGGNRCCNAPTVLRAWAL
jgi:hypothetical protein